MDKPDLASSLQALLFVEGGTMSRKKITALLKCSSEELQSALDVLEERLAKSGLALIQSETEASLVASREASAIVQEVLKKELDRTIGDAGLEVLAITTYLGPSTRARIDYIRGVNSASTLRNLLARGLVERTENPEDAREFLYRPTTEALAHLGVTHKENLPEYDKIVAELAAFEEKSEPFETEANAHGNNTA